MAGALNIPNTQFLSADGRPAREWLLWLVNPSVLTLNLNTALPATSGGTGTSATPTLDNILVGNGTAYIPAPVLPASAFPALVGDVTSAGGTLTMILPNVNANAGSWGDGTHVGSFTVNAKGLMTAASTANITGAPGDFTAVGKFGCNAQTAQGSVLANAAIAASAGAAYTATEQGMLNDIKALINQIRGALVANGIMV